MKKAEQHIQSKYMGNAYTVPNWNDIYNEEISEFRS